MNDSTPPAIPTADPVPEDERLGASAADRIIALFGGIRPMAAKLGIPVTTVQGWKKRGQIPPNRHESIRETAASLGLALDAPLLAEAGAEKEPAAPPAPVPEPAIAADALRPPDAEAPPASAPPTPSPDPVDAKPAAETIAVPPFRPAASPASASAAAPAPNPPPGPAPVRPPTKAGMGAGFAIIVALIALAASLSQPLWGPQARALLGLATPPPAAGDDVRAEIEALKRTLEAAAPTEGSAALGGIENRLAALEQRPAAPAAPDPALAERLATLESRTAAVADRAETLAAEWQALAGREREALGQLNQQLLQTRLELQALRREVQGTSLPQLQAQARALLLMQLRAAVQTGAPFQPEWQSVARQIESDPALQAQLAPTLALLEPIAPRGAPTRAALEDALPPIIRQEARAAHERPEASWWQRLLSRLSTVLTVRPAPGAQPDGSWPAALAAAEAALESGDLPAAVAVLAAQQSPPASVARWLSAAQDRLRLDEAIAPLGLGIVQALPRSPPPVMPLPLPPPPAPVPENPPAAAPAPPPPALELAPMIGVPE